jgi:hypothetical protein
VSGVAPSGVSSSRMTTFSLFIEVTALRKLQPYFLHAGNFFFFLCLTLKNIVSKTLGLLLGHVPKV